MRTYSIAERGVFVVLLGMFLLGMVPVAWSWLRDRLLYVSATGEPSIARQILCYGDRPGREAGPEDGSPVVVQ
jgi:hypothetical protein